MKKKHIAIVICCALFFYSVSAVHAENFEGREDEMNNKCAVIKDKKTQDECRQYKEYLENKSKNMDKEIDDIKGQIADVKGDADKVRSRIHENQKQIQDYERQIASIQGVIDKTNHSIQKLNTQIQAKAKDIKVRDKQMKERIIELQPYIGSNNYIDFLMGATSFTDLLRRTQIIGELNAYESDQIKTLSNEKAKLNNDKQIVVEQKALLEVQKKNVDANKEKVVALNTVKTALLNDYQKQEASLTSQKRAAQMAKASIPKINLDLATSFDEDNHNNSNNSNGNNNSNSNSNSNSNNNGGGSNPNHSGNNAGESNSNNNSNGSGSNPNNSGSGEKPEKPSETPAPKPPVKPTTSFLVPLAYGTWHYEAGTWHYPGGGGHMGMDFSTGGTTGIPVVAPADGIIIYSYNGGCDNNGFSDCGIPSGGGNNTLLLTKKDKTIYAMPFYHLTSATRASGTKVSQGDIIGYSGNSGNSTGPHTHVEIIRVGNMSMSDALSMYNRTGDLTFGTGWNADSPHACGSAPCRERPESYWQ